MSTLNITSADCTNSGNNAASNSWAISRLAQSTGDSVMFHLTWDDSTNTTAISKPSGPGGETPQQLINKYN